MLRQLWQDDYIHMINHLLMTALDEEQNEKFIGFSRDLKKTATAVLSGETEMMDSDDSTCPESHLVTEEDSIET